MGGNPEPLRQTDDMNSMGIDTRAETTCLPTVGVWEQLQCYFAWEVQSEDGPGRSLAGATTGNPKQRRNNGIAPTRQRNGRRQWRPP